MKLTNLRPLACLAAGIVLVATGTASAEFIVNSQVVSDEACPGGHSDGYAGDISAGDAGMGEYVGGVGSQERAYGRPDLFYNFYTQGQANRANAQMYPSPHPVPPNVGHTFLTYQPFHPHEYLYGHTNRFHNYYDNGRGMNRTRVHYSTSPVHSAIKNIYWNKLRLPR